MSNSHKQSLFYEAISVIDYALFDPEHGFMGQSFYIDIELWGLPNSEHVLFDFSHCKKIIKSEIDHIADHRLILAYNTQYQIHENHLKIELNSKNHEVIQYECPRQAVLFIDSKDVTPENLAQYLSKSLKSQLPENISEINLYLREDSKNTEVSFSYTHGLKQNTGNCQRLVHGHKSHLQILIDGENNLKLSHEIANWLNNKHLCFQENLASNLINSGNSVIEYESQQGLFRLSLPSYWLISIPIETTAENLAKFIFDSLPLFEPNIDFSNQEILVKVYEGLSKGSTYRNF